MHHFLVMHIFHELFEDLLEGKRREGQTSRDWPPPPAPLHITDISMAPHALIASLVTYYILTFHPHKNLQKEAGKIL